MRVVAGELGGRRLEAPKGDDVRPTSDRAREALYSILGDVSGLDVLDLFCGTGALGIEALSRGAGHLTLVDVDTGSAEANVASLGIGERAEVVRRDAMTYLETTDSEFGLILCDPPYRLAAPLAPALEKLVPKRLASHGRLVVESPAREPLDLPFDLDADRRYGEASLRIWRVQ